MQWSKIRKVLELAMCFLINDVNTKVVSSMGDAVAGMCDIFSAGDFR